jgi:hypothetical protein
MLKTKTLITYNDLNSVFYSAALDALRRHGDRQRSTESGPPRCRDGSDTRPVITTSSKNPSHPGMITCQIIHLLTPTP